MTRSSLALLVALIPLQVSAQTIYKCTDTNGSTTYSSSRLDKNCKVISSGPENSLPAPKAKPAGAAANPSPSGFPRVAEDAQKARDGDRRHILEQELAGEQRNLEQARKELAEQEAAKGGPSDRTAPYRDRVGQHERNIQAIQKELGNLK
ncbi:DUF4124 domain-containing protein [uncultured Dechloromonas sp.]|uniref:DUF4124 domain-containing protein n=1 Tax=uncultured Dechloromonas sp. TaxID=171719 RepID=UPI0025F7FFFE|nr:DUF4124 domain-containing protein [uncultured Dechloromonas sp.]